MHAFFKMKLHTLGLGLLCFTMYFYIEDVLCFLIVNYNVSLAESNCPLSGQKVKNKLEISMLIRKP